jgi:hypothetical protein
VFALTLTVCAYSTPPEQEKKVDIQGKIAKITPASREARGHGRLGTFMLEGVKPDGTEDSALITVTTETLIFAPSGRPADFQDLREEQPVAVTFKGPVSMSYPVMAAAGEIRMLEQTGVE